MVQSSSSPRGSSSSTHDVHSNQKGVERVLSENAPPTVVRAACQSFFAAELLHPSGDLWLIVPNMWNVPVLDNRANNFQHIEPNWPQSHIRLISVLKKLAEEGSHVRILTTDDRKNDTFVHEVGTLDVGTTAITVRRVADWQDRLTLVASERFSIQGGLALSRKSGLSATSTIRITTETSVVSTHRETCRDLWQRT